MLGTHQMRRQEDYRWDHSVIMDLYVNLRVSLYVRIMIYMYVQIMAFKEKMKSYTIRIYITIPWRKKTCHLRYTNDKINFLEYKNVIGKL